MKLLAIITLLIAQQTVRSLHCNYCIGSKDSDCAKGEKSSMISIPCGMNNNNSFTTLKFTDEDLQKFNMIRSDDQPQANCAQFVAPLQGTPAFGRTCVVVPNGYPACPFLEKIIHATHCLACTSDLCNSQPYSNN